MRVHRCPSYRVMLVVLVLVALPGCGAARDTSTQPSPPPDTSGGGTSGSPTALPTCTSLVLAPAWQGVLDGCSSPTGTFVAVKNVSPLLLHVQAPSGTYVSSVTKGGGPGAAATLDLVASLHAHAQGNVDLAPGSSVTGRSSTGVRAALDVSLPVQNAAADYAARTLTSYVQAKLGPRAPAVRDKVAACADEASSYWLQRRQQPDTPLQSLLADAALGPVLQCRSLVKEVSSITGERPPEATTLAQDLARHTRSTVWDDVLKLVRNALTVA